VRPTSGLRYARGSAVRSFPNVAIYAVGGLMLVAVAIGFFATTV
jgi:hypothetical protein